MKKLLVLVFALLMVPSVCLAAFSGSGGSFRGSAGTFRASSPSFRASSPSFRVNTTPKPVSIPRPTVSTPKPAPVRVVPKPITKPPAQSSSFSAKTTQRNYSFNPFTSNFLLWYLIFNGNKHSGNESVTTTEKQS